MAGMAPAVSDSKTSERRGYQDRSRQYRLADLPPLASEDGFRYEILKGDLIVTPAPGRPHGAVAARLVTAIQGALHVSRSNWCLLPQPINLEVETEAATYHCEPDLTIFDQPLEVVVTDDALPPVIVVEIVSPGNPENDYVRKVEAYAVMGIPEYWIVDPGNRAVTYLKLVETTQGRRYTGQPHSTRLPDLTLDPAALFNGLPG